MIVMKTTITKFMLRISFTPHWINKKVWEEITGVLVQVMVKPIFGISCTPISTFQLVGQKLVI